MTNSPQRGIGSTVRPRRVAGLVALVFAAVLAGCSPDPEDLLLGQWEGDSSATANAMRAARLKSESPDASTSTIMAAARAMGAIGIEFRKDKTFTLIWQDKTMTGTWSYDATRKDVQLDFAAQAAATTGAATTGPATATGPAARAEAPRDAADPAKAATWVAELDADRRRLEVFMLDRPSRDYAKSVVPDMQGIVLKK